MYIYVYVHMYTQYIASPARPTFSDENNATKIRNTHTYIYKNEVDKSKEQCKPVEPFKEKESLQTLEHSFL